MHILPLTKKDIWNALKQKDYLFSPHLHLSSILFKKYLLIMTLDLYTIWYEKQK